MQGWSICDAQLKYCRFRVFVGRGDRDPGWFAERLLRKVEKTRFVPQVMVTDSIIKL